MGAGYRGPSSNPTGSSVGLGSGCAALGFIFEASSRGFSPVLFHQRYSNPSIAKCQLLPIGFVFLERPKYNQNKRAAGKIPEDVAIAREINKY